MTRDLKYEKICECGETIILQVTGLTDISFVGANGSCKKCNREWSLIKTI